MNEQTIVYIFQGLQLLGTLIPVTKDALETAAKIKSIFDGGGGGGGEFTVKIQTLQDGAIKDATDTIDVIDQWKKARGLK